MALNVGDIAPDFTLPADDGAEVHLADLRGQWVIVYFYPRDNTPGCTTEACAFRDQYAAFRDAKDAVILGVSADSIKSHVRFRAKHELPFRLLSDGDHEMMTAWQVWGEKKNYGRTYMGIIRSTFIINPAGEIAASWHNLRVKGHVDKVLARLIELQAAAAAPSAC